MTKSLQQDFTGNRLSYENDELIGIKFIGFMFLWTVTGYILEQDPVETRAPISSFFSICIVEDNMATMVQLSERNGKKLCQQSYDSFAMDTDGYRTTKLVLISTDNNTSEWQITQNTDSLASPLIFRYEIQDDTVTPLWWSRGGQMNSIINYFFAWIISIILWKIILWVLTFPSRSNREEPIKNANIEK